MYLLEITIGIVIALIYAITTKLWHKENPNLSDFITVIIAGASIVYGLELGIKIYEGKPTDFGIFKTDILYICLGIVAVIWTSFSSIIKNFKFNTKSLS